MFKIKYKLLLTFFIIIFLLTANSIYIAFLTNKLGKVALETTEIKQSADDIVLKTSIINQNLIAYSSEQNPNKLSAMSIELDLLIENLRNSASEMKNNRISCEYSTTHLELVDNLNENKKMIIFLKNEEINKKNNFNELSTKIKTVRHDLMQRENEHSKEFNYFLLKTGYHEKEFLFQYKEDIYKTLWLEALNNLTLVTEKENLVDVISIIDLYAINIKKLIETEYDIRDIEDNKLFYLDLTQKNYFEINLSSSHISKLAYNNLASTLNNIAFQRNLSLLSILLSFILSIFIAIRFSKKLEISLKEVIVSAEIISNGNLNYKTNIKSNDELGYLGLMFNKMIKSIKSSKKELHNEHEQMKSIISALGEGLLVVDRNYKIIIANKVAENLLKMNITEFLGKNIRDVLSIFKNNKKISSEECLLTKVFKNKKSININTNDNVYFKSKSNHFFPVEMSINSLHKKQFNGAVIVFRDVTDLKLIEEEREFSKHNLENALQSVYIERDNVQEEINKLEEILNSIGDAVLAVDQNKETLIFNPIAENLTGFKLKDMENIPYNKTFDFIDANTKESKLEIIENALQGSFESSNNVALFTKEKELILIDLTASPIKNRKGEIIGCIVVFRDVTEKRETERLRSDFISTVSHQLRTPLSAMKWFVEILLNEDTGKLKTQQIDIINEIKTSNQNMINFVNQMLSVSRVENEKLAINPEIINLEKSIKKFIKEISPIINEKKQNLTFNGIKDKSLEIKIDKNLLRNIIHNLLANSSRYTPKNGKINLTIKKQTKTTLLFSISDSGIGIPKKYYKKIFKKFSRAENAIKYEASGTGLGLYIIKSILDLIGGKIWFKSKENTGTTFFFTLPIDSLYCDVKKK